MPLSRGDCKRVRKQRPLPLGLKAGCNAARSPIMQALNDYESSELAEVLVSYNSYHERNKL